MIMRNEACCFKEAIREDQIGVSPIIIPTRDIALIIVYSLRMHCEVGIGDNECTLDICPVLQRKPSHNSDFSRKMTIFSLHLFIITISMKHHITKTVNGVGNAHFDEVSLRVRPWLYKHTYLNYK